MAFQNPPPQPPWQYSGALKNHYIYDPQTDLIKVFNGPTLKRPNTIPKASLLQNTPGAPLPPPSGGFPQANTGTQPPNGWQNQGGQARGGAGAPAQPGSRSQHGPQYRSSSGPSQGVTSRFARMGITPTTTQPHDRIVDSNDTEVRRGHPSQMTPPDLRRQGIPVYKNVKGTGESPSSPLHPAYKIRKAGFYDIGRVFLVLWSEPAGGKTTSYTRGTVENEFGERVFSKIRRFVVVRQGANYCTALPISTYGGQGVAKDGVTKSDHAIIYTGRSVPRPHPSEQPGRGESSMQPVSILVDPDSPDNVLDPLSRIDFRAVHTIQHNIKSKALGQVNSRSLASLETQFRNVLNLPAPVPPRARQRQRRQSADAGEKDGSDENGNDEDGGGEDDENEGQDSE